MELYLAVRGSHEEKPRLFPLLLGRIWVAGRYSQTDDPWSRWMEEPIPDNLEYLPLESDPGISRYHFEAGCDEAGAWVRYRNRSSNGVRLNGTRLMPDQKYPLHPDDYLQVVNCMVRVTATVPVDPAWLEWNRGVVLQMARAIDKERCFENLPILADALEEAGCGDRDILNHCRQPSEHVRGCWVIDLILDKSIQ
jgi:hypothetical protein